MESPKSVGNSLSVAYRLTRDDSAYFTNALPTSSQFELMAVAVVAVRCAEHVTNWACREQSIENMSMGDRKFSNMIDFDRLPGVQT